MKTVAVENFTRGMTPDIREKATGFTKIATNFDILTRPNTLTPFHSMVDADGSSTINQLTDFLWYTANLIYGVGITSGGDTKLLFKAPGTSTWSANANNLSSGKTMIPGIFVLYHGGTAAGASGATDKFFGANTDGSIWKADVNGAVAWVNVETTLGQAATSNAIVHSKDDIMYIGAGNILASNNNGTWNTTALTLPSKYIISSICEYGNYLAIACRSNNPIYGKSVVYLWDRDSSLNTLAEVIDFGTGELLALEQVEGLLIGISLRTNLLFNLPDRLVFRKYETGGVADVFLELLSSSMTGIVFAGRRQKQDQRMYFMAEITIDGVLRSGIWGVGKDAEGHWAVWHDRTPNNDTAVALNSLKGFITTGDYAIVSYNDGGFKLRETSTVSTDYAASAIIETVINPAMPVIDYTTSKQLQNILVAYDPIPSGGQVICKYKVNGSAWTTIFTETTTGKTITDTAFDASGTRLQPGTEYQFRVESTGGVMVTGLKYRYEILTTNI